MYPQQQHCYGGVYTVWLQVWLWRAFVPLRLHLRRATGQQQLFLHGLERQPARLHSTVHSATERRIAHQQQQQQPRQTERTRTLQIVAPSPVCPYSYILCQRETTKLFL